MFSSLFIFVEKLFCQLYAALKTLCLSYMFSVKYIHDDKIS